MDLAAGLDGCTISTQRVGELAFCATFPLHGPGNDNLRINPQSWSFPSTPFQIEELEADCLYTLGPPKAPQPYIVHHRQRKILAAIANRAGDLHISSI